MKPKRILLKLSGEVLAGPDGNGADGKALKALALSIQKIRKQKVQMAIVLGAGNFWRYRDNKAVPLSRPTSDALGMLGTLMNAKLLEEALIQLKIPTKALSSHEVSYYMDHYNPQKAKQLLDAGTVLILGGGTGNPYFTTDTTAALRALELDCSLLLKATKVDGVYDSDPMKNKKAKRFTKLKFDEVLDRELEVMDLTAITLCKENQLPIRVFDMQKDLISAATGKPVGTLIS